MSKASGSHEPSLRNPHIAPATPIMNELTANALSFTSSGRIPMISAAMSMSRIAIHCRPIAPRVRLRATQANTKTKAKQNRYFTQASALGPVTAWPNNSRSGAVICPEAEVKLFVTASPEVRAARRLKELRYSGFDTDYDTVLADVRARDARDAGRATAPMVMAEGAVLLDTSAMAIDVAVAAAIAAVAARR